MNETTTTWQRSCLYCDRLLTAGGASLTCSAARCKEREIAELRERLERRAAADNDVLAWGSDLWVRESALDAAKAELFSAQQSLLREGTERDTARARVAELAAERMVEQDGRLAYARGEWPIECPYKPGPLQTAWLRGWHAANDADRADSLATDHAEVAAEAERLERRVAELAAEVNEEREASRSTMLLLAERTGERNIASADAAAAWAEVGRLRGALELYANRELWEVDSYPTGEWYCEANADRGAKARAALSGQFRGPDMPCTVCAPAAGQPCDVGRHERSAEARRRAALSAEPERGEGAGKRATDGRCDNCGEPCPGHPAHERGYGAAWRWEGDHWGHRCEGLIPQAGFPGRAEGFTPTPPPSAAEPTIPTLMGYEEPGLSRGRGPGVPVDAVVGICAEPAARGGDDETTRRLYRLLVDELPGLDATNEAIALLRTLAAERAALEDQLQRARRSQSRLRQNREEQRTAKRQLHRRAQAAESRATAAEAEREWRRVDMKWLEDELGKRNRRITELEAKLTAAEARVAEVEGELRMQDEAVLAVTLRAGLRGPEPAVFRDCGKRMKAAFDGLAAAQRRARAREEGSDGE